MRAHLARIEEANPRLNAIVTLLPEETLLRAAETADAAVAAGDPLGPLHGLPVAHKDLTLTRGIRTTFGSPIFADHVPEEDALIVERLRAAGAITIGKTNTPEFGAGSQTFNAVFGPTRNPWDESKTCGGSSGGAAAALASGMVPIADGSDYGGSLRNPASFCGVVGFRPSPGRVPVWPDETPWFPVPVQGPMARSAADAALMLSAIAGPDPRAPLSLAEPGETFRRPLDRDFQGVRVAWSTGFGGVPFDPRVRAALAPARGGLERIGCEVEDAEPDMSGADVAFDRWRAWYFELNWGPLLDRQRESMKDTVIWNIERGRALDAAALAEALPPLDGAPAAGADVLRALRVPGAAGLPGAALRYRHRVSDGDRRGHDAELHGLDGVLRLGVAARLPGGVRPRRRDPRRVARGPPDRRPPARRFRGAPARSRAGTRCGAGVAGFWQDGVTEKGPMTYRNPERFAPLAVFALLAACGAPPPPEDPPPPGSTAHQGAAFEITEVRPGIWHAVGTGAMNVGVRTRRSWTSASRCCWWTPTSPRRRRGCSSRSFHR